MPLAELGESHACSQQALHKGREAPQTLCSEQLAVSCLPQETVPRPSAIQYCVRAQLCHRRSWDSASIWPLPLDPMCVCSWSASPEVGQSDVQV